MGYFSGGWVVSYPLSSLDQNRRENNLNLIRLLAALMVTFSHAWPLTGRIEEPLAVLTGGFLNFGHLGVQVFFVISGLLIAQSFDRSSSVFRYAWARVLRIYPALGMALLLTIVAVEFIAGTLPAMEYFLHPSTVAYLKNNLLFRTQYDLPGVFGGNPYPNSVNGSLWTLRYEVFLYVLVALFGCLGFLRNRVVFNLALLICFLIFKKPPEGIAIFPLPLLPNVPTLAACFCLGSFFYVNRDRIRLNMPSVLASWVAVAVLHGTVAMEAAYIFALGYSILFLAFHPLARVPNLVPKNDYSYGVYIYSFPVQQLISSFQPALLPSVHFFLACLLVFPLAVFSWHWVEKPALRLKDMFAAPLQDETGTDPAHLEARRL